MIEQEVRLAVGEAFPLDFGGLDSVVATPGTEQRLSTVYYDSDDLRLARWGLSLRYRAGWGTRTASGHAAFPAGELAALERAAALRARSRWPRAWKHTEATAPTG